MAFSRKVIAVTFQLGEGRLFPDTGTNTRTTVGLKVHVSVTLAGGAAKDNSEIVIYGLSQSVMNELSIYGAPVGKTANNTVVLAAGDEGQPLKLVFKGTIQDAVIDYHLQPEVAFVIRGFFSMLFEAVAPAPPVSIAAGGQKVSAVMGILASHSGYGSKTAAWKPYYWVVIIMVRSTTRCRK